MNSLVLNIIGNLNTNTSADFIENQEIKTIVAFSFSNDSQDWVGSMENLRMSDFTQRQLETMKELKVKRWILSLKEKEIVWWNAIDILLAYSYDHRTTMGEPSVESAWTVAKLSASLSCFKVFENLSDVIYSFMRRSLCYPLYRSFILSKKCLKDVYAVLKKGRHSILGIFLDLFYLFSRKGSFACLNTIWIQDICVWLQYDESIDETAKNMAHQLHHFPLEKSKIGWDLEELETLAKSE